MITRVPVETTYSRHPSSINGEEYLPVFVFELNSRSNNVVYVAMNHFRVAAGRGTEFEKRWRERKSYLDSVPGFVQFHLVRGKDEDDGTQRYASHVIWNSRQEFLDWTHSEEFRRAHAQREAPAGLILEHPRFQGWESVEL